MKINENLIIKLYSLTLQGKDVSRRRLFQAIGSTALAKMEREWRQEVKSRGYKPPEIAKYATRLGIALRKYGKAEHHLSRGSSKAKGLFESANSDFERALEYLSETLQSQPDLRFWIDRDINFNDIDFGYSPQGMPYPIWSKSPHARKSVLPKRTIRDLKREALEEALVKLEMRAGRKPEGFTDPRLMTLPWGCSRLRDVDFSTWKF